MPMRSEGMLAMRWGSSAACVKTLAQSTLYEGWSQVPVTWIGMARPASASLPP